MFKGILHAIWLPIAYKASPNFVGTSVLNTMLNRVEKLGIPIEVLQKIAHQVHHTVISAARFESMLSGKKKPGLIEEIANYGNHLEYTAYAVRDILTKQIDEDLAKTRHPELLKILFENRWF